VDWRTAKGSHAGANKTFRFWPAKF